jgi:hypothetical protein
VDEVMEKAREVTRRKGYYNLGYIRSAHSMVILVHGHPSEGGLFKDEPGKDQGGNLREGGCLAFFGLA